MAMSSTMTMSVDQCITLTVLGTMCLALMRLMVPMFDITGHTVDTIIVGTEPEGVGIVDIAGEDIAGEVGAEGEAGEEVSEYGVEDGAEDGAVDKNYVG